MPENHVLLESDLEPDVWDDPVRGSVVFRTFAGGSVRAPGMTAGIAEIGPGGWLALHRHAPAETYYVLAGQGVLTIDGHDQPLTPGAVAYIPGDAEHGVRSTGGDELRVFYVLATDSFSDVEYRFTASER